jgi:undecaprenyl-diphosphatase
MHAIAFDALILGWLNGHVGKHLAFDRLLAWLTSAHMVKGGVFAAVLWGLWFSPATAAGQALRRAQLIAAVAASLAGELIARALALGLPFRPRPMHEPGLRLNVSVEIPVDLLEHYSSFPSDHAVFFFAVATSLLWVSRRVGAMLLFYATFAICLPRVYFGVHYPSDVLAGAAIGAFTAWALQRGPVRAALARPMLAWERRAPAWFYGLACFFMLQFSVLFEGLRRLVGVLHKLVQGGFG